MSQLRDDFFADLGQFSASDELRPVYERLEADARAWSATVGDEAGLIAFARSLPRRSREDTMRMQSQPDHPEWETTQRLPYANPGYQPRQRSSWRSSVAHSTCCRRRATAEQVASRPLRPPRATDTP